MASKNDMECMRTLIYKFEQLQKCLMVYFFFYHHNNVHRLTSQKYIKNKSKQNKTTQGTKSTEDIYRLL